MFEYDFRTYSLGFSPFTKMLDKWKTLANGESPLMVRVAKGGKRTMQSLGISVNPKYWDFTRNKPKPNCPNKEYIQKIILGQSENPVGMLNLHC